MDQLTNEFYLIVSKDIDINAESKSINYNTLFLMNITENSLSELDSSNEINPSIYLEYFKKFYYYPILEYNNENCHILINQKNKYINNDWTLISGISDVIHIYYRYVLDIETKEIEIYFKNFNTTNIVLNNVIFYVFLNSNLVEIDKNKNISDLGYNHLNNFTSMNTEHKIELFSPNSSYDFNIKCYSKNFDLNNISVEAQFDMVTDQKGQFNLVSESFYIPLTDYFIPDKYAVFETEKYEIFYSTLDYSFTTKCYSFCSPDDIISDINNKIMLIEYKSNEISHKNENDILNEIIKNKYKDFYENMNNKNKQENKKKENNKNKYRENFKIKLATYCIYNFWIYIFIIGDYNSMNNKAILNIDIKSNDLKGLNIIAKEKQFFINELISTKIKFY